MPNTNYMNPESFYPLQTGAPGEAFGSGTVPGSILAGMMLPERMQDYRNIRDVSLQSGRLANMQGLAQHQDYLAAGPSRQSGYDVTTGANRNALALQPRALDIATARQEGEYRRAPIEENNKFKQALDALPASQRVQVLEQLGAASTVLKRYPKNQQGKFDRPDLISQELERQGMTISPNHIESVSNMDPKEIEAAHAMALEQFKQTQQTGRQLEMNETTLEAARIGAGKGTAAGARVQRDINLDRDVEPILEKIAKGEEITPGEWAKYQIWAARVNEATARAGASARGQAEGGVGALDILGGKTPKITTMPKPEPGTVKTQGKSKYKIGQKINIGGKEVTIEGFDDKVGLPTAFDAEGNRYHIKD